MGYIILQITRLAEVAVLTVGAHLAISIGGISFFGFTVPYLGAAYTLAILIKAGASLSLSFLLGALLAILLGWFFSALYRRLNDDSFAVFGVASILAFDALVRSWSAVTGGVLGIPGITRPNFVSSLSNLLILDLIIAAVVLGTEFILLKTQFGRSLKAHKESQTLLSSTGVSAKKVGSIAVIVFSLVAGVSGMLGAWRIQFLDPSFGDIQLFIFGLTVAIIAIKPRLSWLLGATTLVLLVPEVLRFLPFPTSMFAHLRILTYAIALIVLVHRITAKYTETKRLV